MRMQRRLGLGIGSVAATCELFLCLGYLQNGAKLADRISFYQNFTDSNSSSNSDTNVFNDLNTTTR